MRGSDVPRRGFGMNSEPGRAKTVISAPLHCSLQKNYFDLDVGNGLTCPAASSSCVTKECMDRIGGRPGSLKSLSVNAPRFLQLVQGVLSYFGPIILHEVRDCGPDIPDAWFAAAPQPLSGRTCWHHAWSGQFDAVPPRVGVAQTRCAILPRGAAFSLFSSPAVCVLLPIVYSLKRLICCCCTRTLFRFDAIKAGDIIACMLLSKAANLVIRRNGEAMEGLGETVYLRCSSITNRLTTY